MTHGDPPELQQGRGLAARLPPRSPGGRRGPRRAHGRSGVGRARAAAWSTGAPTTARRGRALDGDRQGALRTEERRRGHEGLDLVGLALGLAGRHGRAAEADDAQLVTVDQEVPFVDLAVGDAGVVQPADEPHTAGATAGVVELGQEATAAPEDEEGVVVDGRAGGDDRVGEDAGLAGEQREECLVLDLLEPAEAQRRAGLAVPHSPPDGGQQGGVVGVRPYTFTTGGSPWSSSAWTRNSPACCRSAAPRELVCTPSSASAARTC